MQRYKFQRTKATPTLKKIDYMTPKIIIDGRLLNDKHTGISRYSYKMIEALIAKFGHDNVTVIVAPDLKHKPFNYVQTKLRPFNLFHFFRFGSFLSKLDFDLLYTPFYANAFFKQRKKTYIITVHDLMYQKVPFFSTSRIINYLGILYYNFIVRHSLKNSTIISVSKTTQNDVRDLVGRESLLLREGVNLLANDPSQKNKIQAIPDEYFLYVGNLRMHKNVEFLISAFLKSNTTKKLVICGNYKPVSWQYNSDRIVFLGYVDDATLRTLYANCTAFVFPSLYEGFGLPILEALSLGANVYSSNAGALSEFSNEFISFFDPKNEDELIRLLEIEQPRPLNKEKLLVYLNGFSWEDIQEEFMQIIAKIVNENNKF